MPDLSVADVGTNDPVAALRSLNALATPDGSAILPLVNFHRFLQSPEIVQTLAVTAAESVERLRSWAGGRCLDADGGGIYRHNGGIVKPGPWICPSSRSTN